MSAILQQQNPNALKLIFKGRLDFGSQRTYDMVQKHWQTRVDTYFKADILFTAEQVFSPDDFTLNVPHQPLFSTEKHWRSTTSLLQEIAQFAVMGDMGAWCIAQGQILKALKIQPSADKAAVALYQEGCNQITHGQINDAAEALSTAIEKYARHALAYERRGYVNYKLKNFNDALHDFNRSIDIYPNNPEPYYGRGKVKMLKNEWDSAAQDFDACTKRSLALQPIYWLARLRRGDCLYHAKRYAEAMVELKFFLAKKFKDNDPNLQFVPKANYLMGECQKHIQA
jgi:tetratricopeptide (TPR) repeat protein